jgi:hypothetical protein
MHRQDDRDQSHFSVCSRQHRRGAPAAYSASCLLLIPPRAHPVQAMGFWTLPQTRFGIDAPSLSTTPFLAREGHLYEYVTSQELATYNQAYLSTSAITNG